MLMSVRRQCLSLGKIVRGMRAFTLTSTEMIIEMRNDVPHPKTVLFDIFCSKRTNEFVVIDLLEKLLEDSIREVEPKDTLTTKRWRRSRQRDRENLNKAVE